jgi:N6-L-threonylcarbamoyladenine synthase
MALILGIESSCDETAAAIVKDGKLLANIVSGQDVHQKWGGVIPELASRAHQQQIVPVVHAALKQAGVDAREIDAVAVTRGPGLLGALLVGLTFSKAYAKALGIPLIEINHMHAHMLAHFLTETPPAFPYLSLTVSGGHTQLVIVHDTDRFEEIGATVDDAAGEAFDKTAKILGLPYPGGPLIDKYAELGNPKAFKFPDAREDQLNFSFSGLKTAVLYFVQTQQKSNPNFVQEHLNDLCASIRHTIVQSLLKRVKAASQQTGIKNIAIAGGVSANKGLRAALAEEAIIQNWKLYIPPFEYCTDNAAMIAINGYFKYLKKDFASFDCAPQPRYSV